MNAWPRRIDQDCQEGHLSLVSCSREMPACSPSILSASEQRTFQRYRHESQKQRFLTGRWLVRSVLAARLDCAPHAVPLEISDAGKPMCPLPDALRFNLSHAGALVAVVFSEQLEVGIDVEEETRRIDFEGISKRFFAPAEQEWCARRGRKGFFEVWTRKEALVKAMGIGLTGSWSELDTVTSEWHFHTFRICEDVQASVACACEASALRSYQLVNGERLEAFEAEHSPFC